MECAMSRLRPGQYATVLGLDDHGPMRRRLMELGFVPGERVECLFRSGLGDPTAYGVRGTVIALRRPDAARVRPGCGSS